MKRYIQLFLLLLITMTSAAQQGPTPFHRLTIKTTPAGIATATTDISGYYYDAEGQQQRVSYYVNSDTIDIDFQVPEGTRVSTYCYLRNSSLNGSWKPMRLMLNGELLQELNGNYSFSYTVADTDADLEVQYEFNPDKPGEPSPNSWNAETGELIIDNYDASWPSNFNRSEDYPKVKRYILAGRMDNRVVRIVNGLSYMTNCTFYDFSRTDIANLTDSWYGFKDLPLTEVVMPSTVKAIGTEYFKGTHLQVLSIFALTPPTLSHATHWDSEQWKTIDDGQNAFPEALADGMVVRVPDEALPFYQDDPDWSQFTLVPMDGNFANLTVNLFSSANTELLALYKGMQIELRNVRTGQVRRLLVNGQNTYQFRYLPLNTQYTLTLRSTTGYDVATIDPVAIGDADATITFSALKRPHDLTLTVSADGETADASQYTTTWFAANGEYLARGNVLPTVFESQQVKYLVRLGRELAMHYQQPDTVGLTVGTATTLSLTLGQLPRTDITVTVSDALTQQSIADATVSVAQLLSSGETGVIVTLRTDAQGVATGNVVKSLSNITVNSALYGSQTFLANLNDSTVFNIPFRQADGTQLLVNFRYTPNVKEGERGTEQDYTNLKNLKMTFEVNDGGWRYITDYRDQSPRFTFYEKLPEGTRLEVSAESLDGSLSGSYNYANVGADGNATVTLQLRQRGNICVGYRETAAQGTGVMLFDSNGRLVQRKDFGQKYSMMYLEQLASGTYTVVAMANMGQMKGVAQLSDLGFLTEGKDYVSKSIYVSDGTEYDVYFDMVPQPTAFMPSNLKNGYAYLGSTLLSVGDYAVVLATAELDADVAQRAENIRLFYRVPQNCDLVNNSVMKDNNTFSYDYNSYRRELTVDWSDAGPDSRIRFCLIPTQPGDMTAEARLLYTLDGEEHSDLLQTNSATATAASINIHDLVVSPSVVIKGKAAPQAEVTVRDGNMQIARTNANSRGDWRVMALLADTTAMSRHDISAVVVSNGVSYQTETKQVTYDPNGIVAKKVTMTYFNYHPVHLENMEVVFDMENDVATPSSYGFSNEPGYNTDFTFAIELNDNSPERVYAVALYVHTKGIETEPRALMAKYNEKKNIWVAYDKFNTDVLPYSVAVLPYYKQEPIGSRTAFDQPFDTFEQDLDIHHDGELPLIEQLRTLLAQGETAYNNGNEAAIPYSAIQGVVKQLQELRGFSPSGSTGLMDYDQLQQLVDELLGPDFNPDNTLAVFSKKLNELGDLINGFQFTTAQGLTEASLLAAGYEKMKLNDGSAVFILPAEDNSWTYVDLARNLQFSLTAQAAARAGMPLRAGYDGENWDIAVEMIRNYAHDIQGYAGMIGDLAQGLLNSIPLWLETSEEAAYQLAEQMENGNLGWFKTQWIAFKYESVLEYNNTLIKLQEKLKHFKVGDAVGTLASIYAFVNDIISFADQFSKLNKMIGQVPNPCPDDQANADQILSEMKYFRAISIPYVLATLAGDAVAVYSAILALQTAGAAPEIGAPTFLGSVTKIAASIIANKIYEKKLKANMEYFAVEIDRLHCKQCNDPDKCCPQPSLPEGIEGTMASAAGGVDCCKDPHACRPFPPLPGPPPGPDSDGILDPSGYVYEGVPSNRLEGVTATVYYKETVKDMYGDEHEQITLWDAESYAQQNPQLTDQNGEYGWDVPMGLWQVKYEKAGYETAYSDWLPVPPPQLDVNQALRQYAQPVVSHVKATQEGVAVGFDKFMKPATLTADNIRVSLGGNALSGTIELLDSEQDAGATYASRLRFKPDEPLPVGQTLTLTVGGDVESYAGVMMGDSYQQLFTVEQAVERLVADTLLNVVYGQRATMTISAQPAAAAAGRRVTARLLSSIASLADADDSFTFSPFLSFTLDEDGKAVLVVSGDMHGTTGLVLQMDDDDQVQTFVEVSVKDESDFILAMPYASHITDQKLYYGTAVELRHELPDAAIYYTLDGSCPCDLEREGNTAAFHVFRYTEPIVITADTHIKAMAVAKGFTSSDIKELDYTLRRDSISRRMQKGWTWVSHGQNADLPLTALGTQADRAIDPDGQTATTLKGATAYLVHNTEPRDITLQGTALNTNSHALSLSEGWNWLPYPLTLTLTPAEALAYAGAEDGDVLVGEQGFAVYQNTWSGTTWIGTLRKLEPGHAYRYKSATDKLFFLNGNIGGSRAPWYQHPAMYRWYDPFAHPDRMPVIARIIDEDGYSVWDADRYQVLAFAGDDCRGNAYPDESYYYLLFLNVVGQQGDAIRFTIYNKETGKNYLARETLTFDADAHGTLSEPITLTIGDETTDVGGITTDADGHSATYSLQGVKQSANARLPKGVYLRSGRKVVVK